MGCGVNVTFVSHWNHIMCLSVQSEQGWAPKMSVWIHILSRAKIIFNPEKIDGTHSHILPVEMTKCTLGDLFAAVNIKPHVISYHRSCASQYFKIRNAKVRRPSQEVSAWFLISSVVLQCIVVFPLLVSHFDYCTFWSSALHATQKPINSLWISSLCFSATYRHQTTRRAYKHVKMTLHIQHFTVPASLFSVLASKQVD